MRRRHRSWPLERYRLAGATGGTPTPPEGSGFVIYEDEDGQTGYVVSDDDELLTYEPGEIV